MPTPPRTLGSGAANAPSHDFQRTDDTHVAELDDDSYERDLHSDNRAGQHAGANEPRAYSAYDVKALHAAMPDFSDEELKQIAAHIGPNQQPSRIIFVYCAQERPNGMA